jgi:hypothetical protein
MIRSGEAAAPSFIYAASGIGVAPLERLQSFGRQRSRAFPGEQISAAVYIHGVPANKLDVQPAMQKVGQTMARALPRGLRSAAN